MTCRNGVESGAPRHGRTRGGLAAWFIVSLVVPLHRSAGGLPALLRRPLAHPGRQSFLVRAPTPESSLRRSGHLLRYPAPENENRRLSGVSQPTAVLGDGTDARQSRRRFPPTRSLPPKLPSEPRRTRPTITERKPSNETAEPKRLPQRTRVPPQRLTRTRNAGRLRLRAESENSPQGGVASEAPPGAKATCRTRTRSQTPREQPQTNRTSGERSANRALYLELDQAVPLNGVLHGERSGDGFDETVDQHADGLLFG